MRQPGGLGGVAPLGQPLPGGQVGRHRGEDVAPVKGGRHRLQAPGRAAHVHRLDRAAEPLGGQPQQAVVRADQQAVLLRAADRHRAALGAHLGIHHRQVHAGRQVRQGVAQDQRPGADVVARDAVGDVEDPALRGDARDHPVADADEVVDQAVVGEERDHRGHRTASRRIASTTPSTSWRVASRSGSAPCSRSVALVTGPIETIRPRGAPSAAAK